MTTKDVSEIREIVSEALFTDNRTSFTLSGDRANLVDALFAIADAINSVSSAMQNLGNADAATPMGAIEMLAKEVRDGFTTLSTSIEGIGAK